MKKEHAVFRKQLTLDIYLFLIIYSFFHLFWPIIFNSNSIYLFIGKTKCIVLSFLTIYLFIYLFIIYLSFFFFFNKLLWKKNLAVCHVSVLEMIYYLFMDKSLTEITFLNIYFSCFS